ncbi:hypothetical protein HHI36_006868 [Cryptolaemus montrouzieri]|uniref:protein-serine/threonine phosphatase n=1 Tax=Cryptolaemus montrouzieri TaxID=559131 RepID=A0ABD2MN15_9CUCU
MFPLFRSALQTLHKVSSKAREQNYFQAGLTHGWVDYYEDRIESDRSCLNEWHAMDSLESKRPPSPDSIRTKPTKREETEQVIRNTLKEIMMSVDLDEVTSKYIRTRLEEELDVDLGEYKSFIDQEMLTILGSEWNASNFEELRKNGVGHILNVTKEIDNFFPGTFDYLNIRVYDDEKTDLLKHWDDTFKYITKARNEGSKVLVHCKMGVSRSASVVIAYAMKAYNWDFKTAWKHVKEKRTCIKPNTAFLAQLETYRGILDAMKNKEKLQRSKSETNLKKTEDGVTKNPKLLRGSAPTPIVQALRKCTTEGTMSGKDLKHLGLRPKSWSPDCVTAKELMSVSKSSPVFLSLEDLSQTSSSRESVRNCQQASDRRSFLPRHMLMPCDNGESYSVSPNQIVHLPGQHMDFCTASVKDRINELESNAEQKSIDRKKLVLNLACQIDAILSEEKTIEPKDSSDSTHGQIRDFADTWDPGESPIPADQNQSKNCTSENCDSVTVRRTSEINQQPVWTSSTVIKTISKPQSTGNAANKVPESHDAKHPRKDSDPFSNILDHVFDREEKKQQRISVIPVLPVHDNEKRECPSRQNSWSSYDSAVVMGGQTELSRHSSWGSGDTRTLPSRNSSWGSYDIKPRGPVHYINEKGEKIVHNTDNNLNCGVFDRDDVPWWHSGTVRRTKQKLEDSRNKKNVEIIQSDCVEIDLSDSSDTTENSDMLLKESPRFPKRSSAISKCIEIPRKIADIRQKDYSRLSLSAPEPSSMNLVVKECSLSRCASSGSTISKPVTNVQPSSVKQHGTFLENSNKEVQVKKTDDLLQTTNISGMVRNLKRNSKLKLAQNLTIITIT